MFFFFNGFQLSNNLEKKLSFPYMGNIFISSDPNCFFFYYIRLLFKL